MEYDRRMGIFNRDKAGEPNRQESKVDKAQRSTERTGGFAAGNIDDSKRGRGASRDNRYARDDE